MTTGASMPLLLSTLLAAAEPSSAPSSTAWRGAFLLTRAGDAFSKQRFEEAEQLFKSLLKLEPDSEVALIHLAAIANKRGDKASAAGYLSTAAKMHPASFAAQHELGVAYVALGRPQEALSPLDAAVALDPKSLDARLNLGDAYMRLQRWSDASIAFERVLELDPAHAFALRQAGYAAFMGGDAQSAVRHLQLARKLLPNDASVALTLGHALAALGNDASALQAYDAAISAAPKQSAAYVFAGNMLDRMGKHKDAEVRYREAIRTDPRDTLARVHLGNLMRQDGRTLQAQREYEAALRVDGQHVWALTQLGFLLFEKQENARAEKLLALASKLAPNDDEVEVTLGDLYALSGRGADAEIRFRRVLGRHPTHLGALVKLGNALEKRGLGPEALALYERAVSAHPRSAWARIALGDALRARGRNEEARARYRQALDADPLSMWAQRQLGYVSFDLQEYEAALETLRATVSAYPDEAGVPLVMGHAARKLGRFEEALSLYRQAVATDPKSALAKLFVAVALTDLERFDAAIQAFQQALASDATLFEGWVLLGDVATRARMLDVGRDAYLRALGLKANAAWPKRQLGYLEFLDGKVDAAQALLEEVAAEYPEDVEIPLILGHAARARSAFLEARAFYERAKALSPKDVRAYVFLAAVLRELGDLSAANAALRQASEIAPESAWAHYERAQTLAQLGRVKEAITAARVATSLDPDVRDQWLFVGRLQNLARHYDEAVQAYAEAARVDPSYAPGELGYAGALLYRDRFGDLQEAAERVERAVSALPNDPFAHLVTGHVFTRVHQRTQAGQKFPKLLDVLLGQDALLSPAAIAASHLRRAVELSPDDQGLRLSAASSFALLSRGDEALAALEPLLLLGEPLCPKQEWEGTWSLEGKSAEALLSPKSIEEEKALPSRDRVAIAYMLAGDIALKRDDKKGARMRYACATAVQPERPEAHLQLGFAYESDAFYRLAEQHYVLAQRLALVTLANPQQAEPDVQRSAELQRFADVATEAVGRLRKEAGFPITPAFRASAETAYVSDSLGMEQVARLATLLRARNQDETLALTVPRTFFTLAAFSLKPVHVQAAPRFELQYRFFREEGTFWNDRQSIEPRLGHVVSLGAHGTLPLRIAETELRYSIEQKETYADSTSRQEVRSNTLLRSRLSMFRVGDLEAQLGYEHGAFIPRDSTAVVFGLVPDTGAHTFFAVGRIEPNLRRYRLDAGLEYRTEQVWLAPSGKRVYGHSVALELGSRLGNWYLAQVTRLGFAATDYVPETIPTVFSYLVKARAGYVFASTAQLGAIASVAGTGTRNDLDYVSVGADGNYRLVWPVAPGRVHTGFYAYAAYELRIAYNLPRFDHLATVGLSFAR